MGDATSIKNQQQQQQQHKVITPHNKRYRSIAIFQAMFCSPTALSTILLALTALVRPASSSAKERELIEVEVSPEHNFSNLLTMIFPYEITEASVKDFEGIANVVKKSFNELQLDSDLCDIHDRIITQVVPLRVGSMPLNSSDDGIPLWLRDAVLPRTEDLAGNNNNNNNHHHRLRNLRRKLVVGELKPHWYYDLPQEDRTGVLNGAEFIETVFLLRGTCQNCVPLNAVSITLHCIALLYSGRQLQPFCCIEWGK
jgi:hypothetical protein